MKQKILITGYLLAIVTANWLVATYGPEVSVFNAFVFIGLNITTRDFLHEIWQGKRLKLNMFFLILSGSILSIFFNAGWIALASFASFAVSEAVDAFAYSMLNGHERWLKINGSNLPSALADSVIFPLIAFGWPPLWGIMLLQFAAKVGGGFIWSILLDWHTMFVKKEMSL